MDEDMRYEYGRIEISGEVAKMQAVDQTMRDFYAAALQDQLNRPGLAALLPEPEAPAKRRRRRRLRWRDYRRRLRDARQVLRYGAWLGDGWE